MKVLNSRIKQRLSIVLAGAVIISTLSSCGNSSAVESSATETVPPSSSVVESSVSETTAETTEETSETSFTVETEAKNYLLSDYAIDDPNGYALNAYAIVADNKANIKYGFDNPYVISELQELAYEVTGVQDDTLTLYDVSYFQGTGYLNMYSSCKFSTGTDEMAFFIETVRAVLASEGLRFGIDEIPASFFAKRFPRFYYDVMEYEMWNKPLVDCWEELNIDLPDLSGLESLWEVSDDMLNGYPKDLLIDFQILKVCKLYNMLSSCYMYNNPWGGGFVIQVKDAATGMNVLVPTEGQAEQLQEDINSMPGCENINIYVAETPEEFYECYGYYPDDLVYGFISEDNTLEGFEAYYNSLPEDEQNELYAPILFD